MQALIFAAGLGTRLRPLTDTRPKALVEVGGRTLLDITIDRLRRAGCGRIVVNVHHFGQMIIDHIAANYAGQDIVVSDERDRLLDTGGGLRKALPLFGNDEPVMIHNVDVLHNADLSALSCECGALATLLVSPRTTQRYFLFDSSMRLGGWTNTATGETIGAGSLRYAFSGLHIVSPAIAPLLDAYAAEHGDAFGITPFYIATCGKALVRGVVDERLRLLDVGKTAALPQANDFIKLYQ